MGPYQNKDIAQLATDLIANLMPGAPNLPTLITSNTVSVSGNVPSGALAVTFTTSDDFVGSINGLTRAAGTPYVFNPTAGHYLPQIDYIITAGSIDLDIVES